MRAVPSLITRLRLFVLLGALLLFGMEPLIGRLLLPSCGGGFHVWAACLMFFQGALFLGYLYCHVGAERLGRGHLLLVLLPLAFLPIGRGLSLLDPDPSAPTASIAVALTLAIAVPFVLLSTTGVIAQRWLAESDLPERANPYQLYAASNAGSFVALLAYPLVIEPAFGLATQRYLWSAAFLGYVLLAFSVFPRRKAEAAASEDSPAEDSPAEGPPDSEEVTGGVAPEEGAAQPALAPSSASEVESAPKGEEGGTGEVTPGRVLVWLLLSAAPSALLMAVTNVIAMDLGSLPMVWVVPLALYLLTFVFTFGPKERYPWAVRRLWPEALVVGLVVWLTGEAFTWVAGLVQLSVLVLACWVGHAELYRSRPPAKHLTAFYLCVSLGGWLGGVFVAMVAPFVFQSLAEYPLALAALALTLGVYKRKEFQRHLSSVSPIGTIASACVIVGGLVYAGLWAFQASQASVVAVRNEYGIYRVGEGVARKLDGSVVLDPRSGNAMGIRAITHGTIVHGKELVDPAYHGVPIGYFHRASPLGEALAHAPRPLRLAIVGLGAGALAGTLRPGDELTYYELDPLVERLAREHFHYLEKTPATLKPIVHGDARLELRKVPDGSYDVILVDAFSSDAIPVHLLTREALTLYRKKLSPKGWLVFHISSRYYDLRPVIRATGAAMDPPLGGCVKDKSRGGVLALLEDPSTAYVLSPSPASLQPLLELAEDPWKLGSEVDLPTVSPWTDDYANVLGALWARWK